MSQEEVLRHVIEVFNDAKIVYMLTGGIAVSYYGRPRFTHDVDFVVQALQDDASVFENAFQRDFYVSREGIVDAIQHHTMFNLIHNDTGLKIDCWVVKNNAYGRAALSRRVKSIILDVEAYISTPEDLILAKLDWFKASGTQKHFDDVIGIIQLQADHLDMDYLNAWTNNLALGELLEKAFESATLK